MLPPLYAIRNSLPTGIRSAVATVCKARFYYRRLMVSVCLSVRLSVTLAYYIEMAKDIIVHFTRPSSAIILVF